MDDNEKAIIVGAWVEAVGTIVSAIGSTPNTPVPVQTLEDFNLTGNTLQATGNGILADSENGTLEKTGSLIQAAGNSTIIYAILLILEDKSQKELFIKGNLLQAFGSSLAFVETLKERPGKSQLFLLYGSILQAIGNVLQVFGDRAELLNENGENVKALGSWIQAFGANLYAIGITL
ncbi:DUF6944 family repetitive protein [Halobacillus mangrovi]|uniref:DUF6944 family repetitive protein n=1 Tax=Halobacillus mangrovi TaxID=402384 RepID=UPI003D983DBB